LLYEGFISFAPKIGASVGRAVALAQAGNPSAGMNALDALPQSSVINYQPVWAARGHLLRLLNRNQEARDAFTRAASLTDDPALREHLSKRASERRLVEVNDGVSPINRFTNRSRSKLTLFRRCQ
jgi:predicted RNA polymerase sigma factor